MLTAVPPEQDGAVAPEQMVIVPLDSVCVTGAEKTSVLIPVVPLPLVTSASFVLLLLPPLPLSLTVTVCVPPSMATVTKMVFPIATVTPTPVWVRVVVVLFPLFAVPMGACLMVLITVMFNGLEAAETAPIASVAFAVITCVPTLSGVVTLTPVVLFA